MVSMVAAGVDASVIMKEAEMAFFFYDVTGSQVANADDADERSVQLRVERPHGRGSQKENHNAKTRIDERRPT